MEDTRQLADAPVNRAHGAPYSLLAPQRVCTVRAEGFRASSMLSDLWRSIASTLVGRPEFTRAEVAAQAGVSAEETRRLWKSLGFAPVGDEDRVFTDADVAIVKLIREGLERGVTTPDVLFQLTRVTGQALARVAEAQISASGDQLDALRVGDVSQEAAPATITRWVERLVPTLEPFVGYVWRRHLLAALFRAVAASDVPSAPTRTLAVGFADLVGFTAISQQLDAADLAAMVNRFEALAYEEIPEHGGRVVKMIGDEVMFCVEEPRAAAAIALALSDAYAGEAALPDVRVGLAYGEAVPFEGDLFGSIVNLASRLVNIARPGTILVSEELAEVLRAPPALAVRPVRPLQLKGIGRVRVWVLRSSARPIGPDPQGGDATQRGRSRARMARRPRRG